MSLLIKNGRIITADADYVADLFIDGEVIHTIGKNSLSFALFPDGHLLKLIHFLADTFTRSILCQSYWHHKDLLGYRGWAFKKEIGKNKREFWKIVLKNPHIPKHFNFNRLKLFQRNAAKTRWMKYRPPFCKGDPLTVACFILEWYQICKVRVAW